MSQPLRSLTRQLGAFAGVGILAAVVHYGLLIGLVEGHCAAPVGATLTGYVAGGADLLSAQPPAHLCERPGPPRSSVALHPRRLRRFPAHLAVHAGADRVASAPYLPAQLATTGIVLVWSFIAHKLWTFGAPP